MRGKQVWRRDEVRLIACSEDICEHASKDNVEAVDNASWLWAIIFIMLTGFTYHEGPLFCLLSQTGRIVTLEKSGNSGEVREHKRRC